MGLLATIARGWMPQQPPAPVPRPDPPRTVRVQMIGGVEAEIPNVPWRAFKLAMSRHEVITVATATDELVIVTANIAFARPLPIPKAPTNGSHA